MTTTPENAPQLSPQQKTEKMLNKAGFALYAAKYAEKQGMADIESEINENSDIAQSLHETYDKADKVKNDLKNLFREDVSGLVTLEGADFASIDTYIDGKMLEGPEKIKKLVEEIESVKKDAAEIKEKETKIKDLSKKRDNEIATFIKDKKALYTKALASEESKDVAKDIMRQHKKFNLISPKSWKVWTEKGAKKIITDELAILNNNGEAIARAAGKGQELDVQIAELDVAQKDQKEGYMGLKATLLQNSEYATSVHTATQRKIKARVIGVLNDPTKDLSKLDKEQAVLGRVAAQKESGDSFDYLSDVDFEQLQKNIDQEAEATAKREVDKKLDDLKIDSAGAFSSLEKGLNPYMQRGGLGSKEKDEAREFILTTLKDKLANLKRSVLIDNKAKAILLSNLIRKMENSESI